MAQAFGGSQATRSPHRIGASGNPTVMIARFISGQVTTFSRVNGMITTPPPNTGTCSNGLPTEL